MGDLPKLRQDADGKYYLEYDEGATQEKAGRFLLQPLVLPCSLPDEAVGALERWQMAIISEQTALAAERDALKAERDRLVNALREIADQRKTDEFETEYDVEVAYFKGGYDLCIDRARDTLAKMEKTDDQGR